MTTYPDSAYQPVMDAYDHLPKELKPKANEILEHYKKEYAKGEAPPENMKKDLEALLTKNHKGGLEQKTASASSGIFSGRRAYATGLIGVLAMVGALSVGIPSIHLPIYQPLIL